MIFCMKILALVIWGAVAILILMLVALLGYLVWDLIRDDIRGRKVLKKMNEGNYGGFD